MLILFDQRETQIGRLRKEDLVDCVQTEPINGIVTLEFTVDYSSLNKMDDVEIVAHRDAINQEALQAYKIQIETPTADGMSYTAIHIAHDDLKGYGYIREARMEGVQASNALYRALQGCRWEVGRVDPTASTSIYFYDLSRQECIGKILDTWDLEINYRVMIENNKLGRRYIDLLHKRGTETGRRYVYGSNALDVVKEQNQSGLYTAIIPRGKGEEKFNADGTPTGGYGRRIQITDIAWSKAGGNPIDKPMGQEYLEIPEMTARFGYSDGTPRFKVQVYSDVEDPNILIQKAYDDLVVNSRPLVQFSAKIEEAGNLELGDQIGIVRHDLDIYYYTRVFQVKRDLLNGTMTQIDLGDNLSITQADFNKEIRRDIRSTSNDLTSSISSAVLELQRQLNESMYDDDANWYFLEYGNEYGYAPGFYTLNSPIDQKPTKGIFIGSGKMGVANRTDSSGKLIYTTWATGDGLVADMITSGTLNADLIKAGSIVGEGFNFNLSTGAFNLANKISYNPYSNTFTIDGNTVIQAINNGTYRIQGEHITLDGDTTVLGDFTIRGSNIVLDGYTTMTSGFTVPQGNIGDLSADKIKSGTIDARTINVDNLNASNLTRGTLYRDSEGTHLGTLNNTSGYIRDGYYGADIQGSATGVNLNSSIISFFYGAGARIQVDGRVDARPNGNRHSLELNGLTINGMSGWFKKTGTSRVELGASGTLLLSANTVDIPNLKVGKYTNLPNKISGIEGDISDAFSEINSLKRRVSALE